MTGVWPHMFQEIENLKWVKALKSGSISSDLGGGVNESWACTNLLDHSYNTFANSLDMELVV